jgi:Transposase DDE domain
VNVHDSQLIPSALCGFVEFSCLLDLDVSEKPFVLDSGFDAQWISDELICRQFIPVIKPRAIRRKNHAKTNEVLDAFESVEYIYKGRFVIERTFAWEDTYRKLNTRYEKLACTFNGLRYLAYSMINFRWLFGKNL